MSEKRVKTKTKIAQEISYMSEEEQNKIYAKRAENERLRSNLAKGYASKRVKIKINGTIFESVTSAAQHFGCDKGLLSKRLKVLEKSCRSEMDFDITMRRTLTFQKIKECDND